MLSSGLEDRHRRAFLFCTGLRWVLPDKPTETGDRFVPGENVFKAHRLLYRSTLGLRIIKKKKKENYGPHPVGTER